MGLFDVFSSGPAEQASAQATSALKKGQKQANKAYDTAQTQIGYGLTKSLAPWQQLYGQAQTGYNTYGDAVGVNGAEGQARALQNFQTDPGYQFQQQQGLDALNRTAASRGMLASGNNTQDILRFSQGLADQSYNQYVNRLAPYLNQPFTAAAGQSGVYGQGVDSALQLAQGRAGAAQNTASGVANAQSQAALAPYNASANMWGAILGLGGAGANALGSIYGA